MKIAEKFERVMMAAAFAEENEHGTARELLTERRETERAAQRPTTAPAPPDSPGRLAGIRKEPGTIQP